MKQALVDHEMDVYFDEEIPGKIVGKIKNIENKENYQLLIIEDCVIEINNNISDKTQFFSRGIKVFNKSPVDSKIGNTISLNGDIIKFQKATNPGQFDEHQYNKILKYDYKVYCDYVDIIDNKYSIYQDFLYNLKRKIFNVYDILLPEKNSGVLSAMILGDKATLDSNIKDLYQTHGISHILAISGLHVSLIGMTLYKALRKLRIRIPIAVVLSIIFIYSYGILTNFSVSTSRAIIMLLLSLISKTMGRTYDSLSAAAFSALIILVDNPLQIFSTGFLLSYGAILGIGLVYPPLSDTFQNDNKIIKGIVDSILISTSVQIMTLPILLYFFFEISTYSILFNIILVPFVSVIIILAIIGGLIGIFNLSLGGFFLGGTYFLLNFYEWILTIANNFPLHTLIIGRPDLIAIITYYFVLFLYILLNYWEPKKYSYFILTILLIICIRFPNNHLEVTFIDVGQGDGIFFESNSGTKYLVDGGSLTVKEVGKYRLIPFLKSKGISKIDYAFISHFDDDHVNGIMEIMGEMDIRKSSGEVSIKNLVLPKTSEGVEDDLYLECISLAKEKEINIIYMAKGDYVKDGDVLISCLHPISDYSYYDKNAGSLVLSVNYNDFDMLLTGDIEGIGEDLLNDVLQEKYNRPVKFDVLKVAHHGSKNSTYKEFLDLIQPSFSIISSGKNNLYGHPHEELLIRLEDSKSKIYTTIDEGAITIYTDGKYLKIESFIGFQDGKDK